MTVLHIVRNLEVGGLERFVVDLVEAQRKLGLNPVVLELFPCTGPSVDVPQGVRRIGALDAPRGGRAGRWLRVWRALSLFRPNVVHAHNTLSFVNAFPVCFLSRIPVVLTKHGMDFTASGHPWVYGLPAHIACVSGPVHARLLEVCPRMAARSSVVLNGVPVPGPADARRRAALRAEWELNSAERVFLWVGRMSPEKALTRLLKTFAAVLESAAGDPPLRLILVGDGPLRPEVSSQVDALGIAPRVRLAGFRPDVRELVAAADVFLLPSDNEGMPIALLEAMAAGLPAIVTSVGEMPRMVADGENGWVIEPGDSRALRERLAKAAAADDALLRAMGARSAELVRERFSIERSARKYQDVYGSVVNRYW